MTHTHKIKEQLTNWENDKVRQYKIKTLKKKSKIKTNI